MSNKMKETAKRRTEKAKKILGITVWMFLGLLVLMGGWNVVLTIGIIGGIIAVGWGRFKPFRIKSRKTATVFLLVFIGLAISGFNPLPKSIANGIPDPVKAVTPSTPTPAATLTPDSAKNVQVTKEFMKFMTENFGDAAWFDNDPKNYKVYVRDNNILDVIVGTNLYPKDSNKEVAQQLSWSIKDWNDNYHVQSVTVNSGTGTALYRGDDTWGWINK